MMPKIGPGSPLGDLRIDRILIDFDGPRFFSSVNTSGQRFLCLFVEDSGDDEFYVYRQVSETRFSEIVAGHLSVRSAFEVPDESGSWIVASGSGDPEWKSGPLPEEWLPDNDAYLSGDIATRRSLEAQEMQVEANELGRPLIAIELDTPWGTTEYPLRPIGELMEIFQEVVDSFAQEVVDQPTARGAIQEDILQETGMSLYDLRAASFAFVIAGAPRRQQLSSGSIVFGESLVSRTLDLVIDYFDASQSDEALEESLGALHTRAVSKLRDFFEKVDETQSSLAVLLSPPERPQRAASLTSDRVSASLRVIQRQKKDEDRNFEATVRLVGVNERTFSFELHDEAIDRRYSGKTAQAARSQLVGLTIGHVYAASLVEEAVILAATGETRYKYRLESIHPATS